MCRAGRALEACTSESAVRLFKGKTVEWDQVRTVLASQEKSDPATVKNLHKQLRVCTAQVRRIRYAQRR